MNFHEPTTAHEQDTKWKPEGLLSLWWTRLHRMKSCWWSRARKACRQGSHQYFGLPDGALLAEQGDDEEVGGLNHTVLGSPDMKG